MSNSIDYQQLVNVGEMEYKLSHFKDRDPKLYNEIVESDLFNEVCPNIHVFNKVFNDSIVIRMKFTNDKVQYFFSGDIFNPQNIMFEDLYDDQEEIKNGNIMIDKKLIKEISPQEFLKEANIKVY